MRSAAVVGTAAAGLLLALLGAIPETRWNDDAVVRVNGVPIAAAHLELARQRLGNDMAHPDQLALRYLVDEELLVQHARRMGLVRSDLAIRKSVIRAVLDRLNQDARSSTIQGEAYRVFWNERQEQFLRVAASEAEAGMLAEREFRMRYPDLRLRALLERLRAGAKIQYPGAFGKPGAAQDGADEAKPSLAARVNGVGIPALQVARFFDLLTVDRREAAGADDLRFALQRVIDEELLFQHGLATGVLQKDRAVRALIARTLLDTVTADTTGSSDQRADAVREFLEDLREAAQIEWTGREAEGVQS